MSALLTPVQSSNIEAIGFEDGVLSVQFKGGNIYDYRGVTPEQHRELMAANSVGSHFHQNIKPYFEGTKRGIVLKLSDLPQLSHALATLAVDMGAVLLQEALVPIRWQDQARTAEVELNRLSVEQVNDLVMGEESEQADIQKLAPETHKLLLDAFDGDLGDIFFKPLTNGREFLSVENTAAELTLRKRAIQEG